MARLNAKWENFSKRGFVWDHFWQDASATVIPGIYGSLAVTLDSVSSSASGVIGHSGTEASALGGIGVASSGKLGHTGTESSTLASVSFSASGTVSTGVQNITGTLAATLDDVSFDAVGTGPTQNRLGGFEAGGKKSYVYIKRGKKFLIFETPSQAAAFIESEKQEEAKPEAKPKKKPKVRPIRQPIAIDLAELEPLSVTFGIQIDFVSLAANEDFDALIQAHTFLMMLADERRRDEEDIELLLLAA